MTPTIQEPVRGERGRPASAEELARRVRFRESREPRRCGIAFPIVACATLLPFVSPGIALMAGIALALTIGNPYPFTTARVITPLLQISVVGLGAGMNLIEVGRAGVHGFFYTVIGITVTMTHRSDDGLVALAPSGIPRCW